MAAKNMGRRQGTKQRSQDSLRQRAKESKSTPTPGEERRKSCPIVGMGASAGGLEAFQKFLPKVPADCGLAFVLVQHLSPTHKSSMGELLGKCTHMSVEEVSGDTRVEPNRVYLIPPNAELTVKGSVLRLSDARQRRGERTPIDIFFRSLAQDQGENAACVILSGTGSDGTLGLRAIKEHGGLTLAQAGQTAKYDGMMRSAVATGLVDYVLPVEEMPAKLIGYFRHLGELARKKGDDGLIADARHHLPEICSILRGKIGHDFGQYKESTLIRRVQRRMQVAQIDDVRSYVTYLREDAREAGHLFKDLLIGVTQFFRDAQAFEALETKVIPKLFEDRQGDGHIRVWVPGCATGEEAYSIAILLRERAAQAQNVLKIQVFASEIDEHALEIARIGRYPAAIAQDVSRQRLERFFIKEDGTYRVISDLREICVFAPHNVLKDPPFSRLDLISCRNLLIYLNNDLQNRLIPILHYALLPERYLFLGPSENVSQHLGLFSTVDKSNRLFKRREQAAQGLPEFPITLGTAPAADGEARLRSSTESVIDLAERTILSRYAPAYVIVNEQNEVIAFSERTGKYLEAPAGAPVTNLFTLARRELRLNLRSALSKARRSKARTEERNITIGIDGGSQAINLVVHPLRHGGDGDQLYLVLFQDIAPLKIEFEGERAERQPDAESITVQELEREIRTTKERLHTTTEELETSNEELKSSNEELSSMNEELQSTNEELETSKEELQSVNEELQTVNAQLSNRVDELARANSDLKNLFENTQVPTLFLDQDLCIRSFTPPMAELFHIIEADARRPITDIKQRFAADTLEEDARTVLRKLLTIERDVYVPASDSSYIMRLSPYRTTENVIDGVVITFVDVTKLKQAEREHSELAAIVQSSYDAIISQTPDRVITTWNAAAERLYGYKRDEAIGQSMEILVPPDQTEEASQAIERQKRGEGMEQFETARLRKDGKRIDVSVTISPVLDAKGDIVAISTIARDITERKQAERIQRLLAEELQHRIKNSLASIHAMFAQTLRGSDSLKDFAEAFEGRLSAMARTHDLLTRSKWDGAKLLELVEGELAPHRAKNRQNIVIECEDVELPSRSALGLGMILHELTANALRHGALSSPKGRVNMVCTVEETDQGQMLRLVWTESGGPEIASPPGRRGFGTQLIERGAAHQLGGEARLEFRKEGLHCTIDVPIQEDTGSEPYLSGS